MESKKMFYWFSRIIILITLGTMIFLSGITMAIILVRVLPFVSPFLNANVSSISSAPGAQFVNAAFPVREANSALLQRMRVDPLMPVLIGVSILRKILRRLEFLVLGKIRLLLLRWRITIHFPLFRLRTLRNHR